MALFESKVDLVLNPEGTGFVQLDAAEQLRQDLLITLETLRGTWRYDIEVGIPYFELVFVKGTPLSVIRQVFRDAILGVPGVVDVPKMDLTFNRQSGLLQLSCDIRAQGIPDLIQLQNSFSLV